jgi:hypothetical protein
MTASKGEASRSNVNLPAGSSSQSEQGAPSRPDEEQGTPSNPEHAPITIVKQKGSGDHKNFFSQGTDFIKQALGASSSGSSHAEAANAHPVANLETLIQAYRQSDIAKHVAEDIASVTAANNTAGNGQTANGALRDVAEESGALRGRRAASMLTQFRILSGRAFKNLYRNPALLTAHYAGAIIIARTYPPP